MKDSLHKFKIALTNLRPYPKVSYSQCGEDLIIDFLLKDMGLGRITYVDIGAHDPISMNNTYKFYRRGGKGVCIDPNPIIYVRLKRHRKRDICLNAGVSETAVEKADFYILKSDTLSTFSKEKAEYLIKYSDEEIDEVVKIPILSINEVMKILPECPNLVSIDTEGMDLSILKGIDYEEYRPQVFCIETLTYEKQQVERKIREIIDFMDACGYTIYADTHINTIFLDRFAKNVQTNDSLCSNKQQLGGESIHEELHLPLKQDLQESDVRIRKDRLWSDSFRDKGDTLDMLIRQGLVKRGKPLRLHLGCGEVHLHGYVNIDYPVSEHCVQHRSAADIHLDLFTLNFPERSVDEIRLHHVFEHFDRPTALGLLCQWHQWLKLNGYLVIETPDFDATLRIILSDKMDYRNIQMQMRHLFGSHEAKWAVHRDGWYEEKLRYTLSWLGFGRLVLLRNQWKTLENLTVKAQKIIEVDPRTLWLRAQRLLRLSLIDRVASEEKLWKVWLHRFEEIFNYKIPAHHPLISIFVPVRNGERYLREALDSLLAQDFAKFEVVIADDGSSDSTLDVAYTIAERDTRVKVLPLPSSGEVTTRNTALKQLSPNSKYFLNHDADDISLPGKLGRLIRYLDEHPEVAIVGCQAEYFDDNGNILGLAPIESEPQKIRETFGIKNSMINSAALIRREVFERIGGYKEEFRLADDYDFFARALLAGFSLANVPEVLHRIRIHPQSLGHAYKYRMEYVATRVRFHYNLTKARGQSWYQRLFILFNSMCKISRAYVRYHLAQLKE